MAIHAFALRGDFPNSKVEVRGGRLTWIGQLKPSPLSDTYTVEIVYAGHGRPEVRVRSPRLAVPEGMRLPHVFPGDDLCLHFPGEWTPEKSIATTIVPWTSEWLLHYEIWVFTGKWTGGGHQPSQGPKRDMTDPPERLGKDHRR